MWANKYDKYDLPSDQGSNGLEESDYETRNGGGYYDRYNDTKSSNGFDHSHRAPSDNGYLTANEKRKDYRDESVCKRRNATGVEESVCATRNFKRGESESDYATRNFKRGESDYEKRNYKRGDSDYATRNCKRDDSMCGTRNCKRGEIDNVRRNDKHGVYVIETRNFNRDEIVYEVRNCKRNGNVCGTRNYKRDESDYGTRSETRNFKGNEIGGTYDVRNSKSNESVNGIRNCKGEESHCGTRTCKRSEDANNTRQIKYESVAETENGKCDGSVNETRNGKRNGSAYDTRKSNYEGNITETRNAKRYESVTRTRKCDLDEIVNETMNGEFNESVNESRNGDLGESGNETRNSDLTESVNETRNGEFNESGNEIRNSDLTESVNETRNCDLDECANAIRKCKDDESVYKVRNDKHGNSFGETRNGKRDKIANGPSKSKRNESVRKTSIKRGESVKDAKNVESGERNNKKTNGKRDKSVNVTKNDKRGESVIGTKNDKRDESVTVTKNDKRGESVNGTKNDKRDESVNGTKNNKRDESVNGTKNDKRDESVNVTKNDKRDESVNVTKNDKRDESVIGTKNDKRDESVIGTKNDKRDESIRETSNGERDKSVNGAMNGKRVESVNDTKNCKRDERVYETRNGGGYYDKYNDIGESNGFDYSLQAPTDTDTITSNDRRSFECKISNRLRDKYVSKVCSILNPRTPRALAKICEMSKGPVCIRSSKDRGNSNITKRPNNSIKDKDLVGKKSTSVVNKNCSSNNPINKKSQSDIAEEGRNKDSVSKTTNNINMDIQVDVGSESVKCEDKSMLPNLQNMKQSLEIQGRSDHSNTYPCCYKNYIRQISENTCNTTNCQSCKAAMHTNDVRKNNDSDKYELSHDTETELLGNESKIPTSCRKQKWSRLFNNIGDEFNTENDQVVPDVFNVEELKESSDLFTTSVIDQSSVVFEEDEETVVRNQTEMDPKMASHRNNNGNFESKSIEQTSSSSKTTENCSPNPLYIDSIVSKCSRYPYKITWVTPDTGNDISKCQPNNEKYVNEENLPQPKETQSEVSKTQSDIVTEHHKSNSPEQSLSDSQEMNQRKMKNNLSNQITIKGNFSLEITDSKPTRIRFEIPKGTRGRGLQCVTNDVSGQADEIDEDDVVKAIRSILAADFQAHEYQREEPRKYCRDKLKTISFRKSSMNEQSLSKLAYDTEASKSADKSFYDLCSFRDNTADFAICDLDAVLASIDYCEDLELPSLDQHETSVFVDGTETPNSELFIYTETTKYFADTSKHEDDVLYPSYIEPEYLDLPRSSSAITEPDTPLKTPTSRFLDHFYSTSSQSFQNSPDEDYSFDTPNESLKWDSPAWSG